MSGRWIEPGRHHEIWKQWRRIGKGQTDRFFLEHRHAVLESLRGQHHRPEQVLLSRELYATEPDFWEGLAVGIPEVDWFLVEGSRLDQVVSVPSSTGLCGVYSAHPRTLDELADLAFLLVLWEVSDPGNFGTLIRAARALCSGGVVAIGGCSAWSSKVARASAGSLLTTRLTQLSLDEGKVALQTLQERGFSLFEAVPRCDLTLSEVRWSGKDMVLLGNESRGLPRDVQVLGAPFSIPSDPDVESLNVAMSGSIVAWEWARTQKRRPCDG